MHPLALRLGVILGLAVFLGPSAPAFPGDDDRPVEHEHSDDDHDRDRGGGIGGGITIDIGKLTQEKKEGDPFASTPDNPQPPHYHTQEKPVPVKLGILLERSELWTPSDKGRTYLEATIWECRGKNWVRSDAETTIIFYFAERSNEPGDCLNHGTGTDPDLWFPVAENPDYTCSNREPGGKATFPDYAVTKNPRSRAVINVACGDWGAFSKVEAWGDKCVPLKRIDGAVEQVDQEDTILTLPKDDNDNQIADSYENACGEHPRPGADDDNTPNGNGVAGDGLSAYEEYRGFMVNGEHYRTEWDQKDLFVYNRDHLPTSLFDGASGLAVHYINESEMDKNKVINFNWHHASLHNQHALVLHYESLPDGLAGQCIGTSTPTIFDIEFTTGPPKNVDRVVVDIGHCYNGSAIMGTTAHELGHAVCMLHHGERSWSGSSFYSETTVYPDLWKYRLEFWLTVGPGLSLCSTKLPADFIVETERGTQLAGDSTCIMRYQYCYPTVFHIDGQWQCVPADPHIRTIFCTSPTGTGMNANGKAAADASRGNCMGQLMVNDLTN
jgi:hypothetical protein